MECDIANNFSLSLATIHESSRRDERSFSRHDEEDEILLNLLKEKEESTNVHDMRILFENFLGEQKRPKGYHGRGKHSGNLLKYLTGKPLDLNSEGKTLSRDDRKSFGEKPMISLTKGIEMQGQLKRLKKSTS